MKKYILPTLCALALLASCSTDGDGNDNEMLDSASLVGTWNMSDVRFEEDPDDTSLNLADEVVDFLFAQGCVLVSFTFNADGTVTSSDKVNYLEINAGPNGLDVPCPTETDIEAATWVLDGNQLTLTDENDEAETITIELESNTLIIAGDEIDANNYSGAEAIFSRQ